MKETVWRPLKDGFGPIRLERPYGTRMAVLWYNVQPRSINNILDNF